MTSTGFSSNVDNTAEMNTDHAACVVHACSVQQTQPTPPPSPQPPPAIPSRKQQCRRGIDQAIIIFAKKVILHVAHQQPVQKVKSNIHVRTPIISAKSRSHTNTSQQQCKKGQQHGGRSLRWCRSTSVDVLHFCLRTIVWPQSVAAGLRHPATTYLRKRHLLLGSSAVEEEGRRKECHEHSSVCMHNAAHTHTHTHTGDGLLRDEEHRFCAATHRRHPPITITTTDRRRFHSRHPRQLLLYPPLLPTTTTPPQSRCFSPCAKKRALRTQGQRLIRHPEHDGFVAPAKEQRKERVACQHVQCEQRGHGAGRKPAAKHCLVAGGSSLVAVSQVSGFDPSMAACTHHSAHATFHYLHQVATTTCRRKDDIQKVSKRVAERA